MKHRPLVAALALLAVSCALLALPATAGHIEQKRFTAKSYQGSRDRDYKVFVPSSYTGQSAVPMVMVLHGCSQTEQNMIAETRFQELGGARRLHRRLSVHHLVRRPALAELLGLLHRASHP